MVSTLVWRVGALPLEATVHIESWLCCLVAAFLTDPSGPHRHGVRPLGIVCVYVWTGPSNLLPVHRWQQMHSQDKVIENGYVCLAESGVPDHP